MQFRKLEGREHGKTRKLYETVFSEDEAAFVDYYYAYRAAENEIYAAEDEAGIHAMVQLNPCEVSWRGERLVIPYIVAVATEKRFRHQGLMSGLLELALREQEERRVPFVFLMPAAEAIYTPFGFRRAWSWRWEEEEILSGTKEARRTGEWENRRWIAAGECAQEQLAELARRVNARLEDRFELFSRRSPAYYRRLAAEQEASGGRLEILMEEGRPVCARCTAREQFPPMMARITNLEAFVARVRTRQEYTCVWKVRDALLPAQEGWFRVTLSPQGGRLERLPARERPEENPAGKEIDISRIPEMLAESDPFLRTMICEVV